MFKALKINLLNNNNVYVINFSFYKDSKKLFKLFESEKFLNKEIIIIHQTLSSKLINTDKD